MIELLEMIEKEKRMGIVRLMQVLKYVKIYY